VKVREIEQFVYVGGGLLVAPGNLSRAEAYTSALYRDGAGVLPASLAAPIESEGLSIEKIDLASPIFAFLNGKAATFGSVRFDRYFPCVPAASAQVAATLSTGQPFCVTSGFGKGRVMLLTCPLNTDWSNFPLSGLFLPFLHSSTRFLSSGRLPERNLESGQAIEISIDQPVEDKSISAILPSGVQQVPDVTRLEGRTDIRFTDTEMPGRYQLRYRSKGRDYGQPFIVRPPTKESDLTSLTDEQTQKLANDLQVRWIDPSKDSVSAVIAQPRTTRELWAALLGAVFGLALLELALARRWAQEVA
jgi:hypothetical protein